jgi:hypothetical protein
VYGVFHNGHDGTVVALHVGFLSSKKIKEQLRKVTADKASNHDSHTAVLISL